MANHYFTSKYLTNLDERVKKNGYKPARHENPWLAGEYGVRKKGLVFQFTKEELFEYAKCKASVLYFAKYCHIMNEQGEIKPMKLRDYQYDVLDMYDKNSRCILMASRQVGKTICAAIIILHYCIFNNDKNVLVTANKKDTTKEILNKVKSIYKLLPFFLKPGMSNWAEQSVTFGDTNCRILITGKVKDAGVGFTINFLYCDEFAHIPKNYIEPFYTAVYPTLSGTENSKLIITSTPKGRNLFWKILSSAELPDDDPHKNHAYASMRVYWYQVKNRTVSYLRPKIHVFIKENLNFNMTEIYNAIQLKYSDYGLLDDETACENWMKIKKSQIEKFDKEIHIFNNEKLEVDTIRSWDIDVNDKNYSLLDIFYISTWKEDKIVELQSEEAFKQEFGLKFYGSDQELFDENTMNRISNQTISFKHEKIEEFEKYDIKYDKLTWIQGKPDIFNIQNIANYHYAISIDLAEGLGKDYTVANIFKISIKDKKEARFCKNIYELFRMEQVGIYKSNTISIDNFAEFVYHLCFNILDQDKIKVYFEFNTYGGHFISAMRNLYNGQNDFSEHIFSRHKHRMDSTVSKIGCKITGNKNIMIQEYQNRLKRDDIRVHEHYTITEISSFVKKETTSGNFIFEAESGNDDIVMSIVGAASLFKNISYRNLIDDYISTLSREEQSFVYQFEDSIENPTVDYEALFKAKEKIRMQELIRKQNNNVRNVNLFNNNI